MGPVYSEVRVAGRVGEKQNLRRTSGRHFVCLLDFQRMCERAGSTLGDLYSKVLEGE